MGRAIACTTCSAVLVVLLYGGDKRTQKSDIKRALAIAAQWKG
jgi:putative component of toxin-antitoxin plasmid stabilization module